MDGNEKSRFDPQQQALFRQWITSPSAGYARQNPDGTPYREPQPTLTDAEREALMKVLRRVREDYFAGRFADSVEVAAVIDGLLERTK